MTRTNDQRRNQLLQATFELIGEKGLEGLRTRDIVARAGVNISTLHYYFATKSDLIGAVIGHLREVFTSRDSATDSDVGTDPLLNHLLQGWRRIQTTPFLSATLQELLARAPRDAVAKEALTAIHAYWNDLVESLIKEGMAAGRLLSDIDASAASLVLTSFVMGARAQAAVSSKPFDFEGAAIELVRCLSKRPPRSPSAGRQ
jgi:AcrR family transcriptional regulator